MAYGGAQEDVSATLGELERKLVDLERELQSVAGGPPSVAEVRAAVEPRPELNVVPGPDPAVDARVGDLRAEIADLVAFRDQLERTARELIDEYGRLVDRLQGAGAPSSGGPIAPGLAGVATPAPGVTITSPEAGSWAAAPAEPPAPAEASPFGAPPPWGAAPAAAPFAPPAPWGAQQAASGFAPPAPQQQQPPAAAPPAPPTPWGAPVQGIPAAQLPPQQAPAAAAPAAWSAPPTTLPGGLPPSPVAAEAPPAEDPGPVFEGAVVVDAGPFTDITTLSTFEQALGQVPGAEDVYVKSFEGDRALIDLRLQSPVQLVSELKMRLNLPISVSEARDGRLSVDVDPEDHGSP